MNPLKKYKGKSKLVRISRRFPGCCRISGYVVDTSKSASLLHEFLDFFPMGYTIIRNRDVTEVQHGKIERCWHRMYEGEKLLSGLRLRFRPDLSSMAGAIWSIASKYRYMTVQCKDEDQAIQDFYLGNPIAEDGDSLMFEHFNVLGEWSRCPSPVAIPEITEVEFDTPYIRHFSKYAQPRPVAGKQRKR